MPVSIVVNQEKAKQHIPLWMRAVVQCEKHMVWQAAALVQFPLGVTPRTPHGVKVNDLNPLWPANHFRALVLQNATTWLAQMRARDFEFVGAEGDILIYGPLAPRDWEKARGTSPFVTARSEPELQQTDQVHFILRAQFLAGQGYVPLEDHEMMAVRAGAEYDRALKDTHGDVHRAIMRLPPEVRGRAPAADVALGIWDENEKKAAAPYGG